LDLCLFFQALVPTILFVSKVICTEQIRNYITCRVMWNSAEDVKVYIDSALLVVCYEPRIKLMSKDSKVKLHCVSPVVNMFGGTGG
jgi:hypothetical protein